VIYLRLFWEFFKTGLFAMGGGMATVPFLFDISAKTGWFTASELADMIAISESTPGPIGVNMATYVGFTTAGIPGGIVATFGLFCPALIVTVAIARFLSHFSDKPVVKTVFTYLRPAVIGLIAFALWRLVPMTFTGSEGRVLVLPCVVFCVLVFCMLRWKKIHPIIWIAVCAVLGILFL
jgi:chromate transporter